MIKLTLMATFILSLSSALAAQKTEKAPKNKKELVFTTVRLAIIQNISEIVIREAYEGLGYKITVQRNPGLRSLVEANEGKHFDGEISRVKKTNINYPNLIRIEVPVNKLQGVAFTHKDSKISTEKGWDTLRPYKILRHRGTVFSKIGTKGFPNVHVTSYHRSGFDMLDVNRVDVIVCPYLVGLDIIKHKGYKNIITKWPALGEYKLFHFLHKKNKDLVPIITKRLQEMQRSGRIAQIRKEFIEAFEKK